MRGMDNVLRNINAKLAEIKGATTQSLNEVALDLKRRSMEIVPHDKGDLEGSCSVIPATEQNNKIKVQVGYGTEYALEQHENLQYRHKEGRKAKYLSGPLQENQDRYIQQIKDSVRGVING